MKMWSGRFRQPLDPAFEHWQRSFEFDCRLLECLRSISLAGEQDQLSSVDLGGIAGLAFAIWARRQKRRAG